MEAEIVKEEKYSSSVQLTVEATVNGEKYTEKFGFSNRQVLDDTWKGHIKKWIQELKKDTQKLEGEKLSVDEDET